MIAMHLACLTCSAVPAAERRPVPERVSAAAHLRAALSRDGRRRARQRPDDRHGAAAAGLGARLRGAAAGLSGRLQRRASRTSSGCPTAATTSCCAGSSGSGSSRRITSAATAARSIEPLRERAARRRRPRARSARQRSKLEAMLAPRDATARSGGRIRARCRRRCRDEDLVNALAQYLDLEPLEKQALLEQHEPARARRVARRAARDEDHDGAHAGPVQRRALTAFRATATLCSPRRVARHEGHEDTKKIFLRDTPRTSCSTADSIPATTLLK